MDKASQAIGTYTPDNIIADNIHPIDTKAVEIAAGSETYERGTIINTSGEMCSTSSDVPVGVLGENVTQTLGSTTKSIMYISGSFNAEELKVGSSVAVNDFATKLQNLGIFLK